MKTFIAATAIALATITTASAGGLDIDPNTLPSRALEGGLVLEQTGYTAPTNVEDFRAERSAAYAISTDRSSEASDYSDTSNVQDKLPSRADVQISVAK